MRVNPGSLFNIAFVGLLLTPSIFYVILKPSTFWAFMMFATQIIIYTCLALILWYSHDYIMELAKTGISTFIPKKWIPKKKNLSRL